MVITKHKQKMVTKQTSKNQLIISQWNSDEQIQQKENKLKMSNLLRKLTDTHAVNGAYFIPWEL